MEFDKGQRSDRSMFRVTRKAKSPIIAVRVCLLLSTFQEGSISYRNAQRLTSLNLNVYGFSIPACRDLLNHCPISNERKDRDIGRWI